MSSVGSEVVRILSTFTIKPQCIIEETQKEFNLTPWDLSFLSAQPIQKGLLFAKTPSFSDHEYPLYSMIKIIEQLKNSLSLTLSHFYPLCGRLSTRKQDDPPSYTVLLDCSDSQGAEFIYAIAEKVTELVDGYFVGCSFNHVVGDGTSFWHFFSTWAEICRKKGNVESISPLPPITKRWFSEEEQQEDYTGFNLPFSHHDEFIERTIASPPLSKRIFHFSAQSITQLKSKANSEACTNKISSLQALSALVWRSVTRVLGVHEEQETACRLLVNDRLRLNPPLSINYFGCCAGSVTGITTSRELLGHELGWAAWLLHEAVASRTDDKVRQWLNVWPKNPSFLPVRRVPGQAMVSIGSSPRFDMYGCEFGWGKVIAVRSGSSVNYSGNVWLYPGREGGGSVDLELCLPQETMSALESDEEFTSSL
ncbi:protein ENHANCED PSEUDOMONAS SUSCEPTIBILTY 1-like isoform X2 [Papaver somniferum]|uniref:protein ENHANCED PSEUDOMONAS SUSCEPTIBILTY 1-like isoform X2 n=1 Tax=Papaver somniferum TaxID=3469 RepID=UPI000E6F7DAF|nr:protein ENHANCED PSEUDOMONAS SUSCEPTIBILTY 1-like isoform X2 [Papaver somniferum]